MRIVIVGAGAIGGFIGTRLAAAGGHAVGALARGATLQALRSHGWRLDEDGRRIQAPVAHACERAEELGVQDLVVIAVKAPALATVAPQIAPLIGPETLLLPAMNGVPWWFPQGLEARLGGEPLHSVDPGGRIAAALPFSQVVACVVHASSASPEPGLVRHAMGRGLILGEPQGGLSTRVEALRQLLADAGFDAQAVPDVRYHLWFKLWGNLTMNPVTAITGATTDRVLDDPLVRRFCSEAMTEAQAVGAALGCRIEQTPEDRHGVTRRLGAFKTSMLQDAEAGRPLELDGIVAAVHELGRRLDIATPRIDALLGLARLFGRAHGLYPEAVAGS